MIHEEKNDSKIDLTLPVGVFHSPHKRIYCVVAQTVQWPIGVKTVQEPRAGMDRRVLYHMEGENSINQPAGRLIAQAAHACSLVSINMTKKWVQNIQ